VLQKGSRLAGKTLVLVKIKKIQIKKGSRLAGKTLVPVKQVLLYQYAPSKYFSTSKSK
jgi:uncharacterized protein with PhoU and TrkA domain